MKICTFDVMIGDVSLARSLCFILTLKGGKREEEWGERGRVGVLATYSSQNVGCVIVAALKMR